MTILLDSIRFLTRTKRALVSFCKRMVLSIEFLDVFARKTGFFSSREIFTARHLGLFLDGKLTAGETTLA